MFQREGVIRQGKRRYPFAHSAATDTIVRRRRVLTALGGGIVAGFAGCSVLNRSPDNATNSSAETAPFEHPGTIDETFATNGEYPPDDDPADGYPPAFSNPPTEAGGDESSFETLTVNGETVKLAPIDVVKTWYDHAEARFVDARGLTQYKRSHVYGSVLSTAQQKSTGGGINGWLTDDRVVTYCGCPHHLSSVRAAGLKKAGFSRVYAIDEGFGAWTERGYPMGGTTFTSESQSDISTWVIEGQLDAGYAGEYAWASADHQYEAAPIQGDGRFTLILTFSDVTAETSVRVSTPAFTISRPLRELTAGVLEG